MAANNTERQSVTTKCFHTSNAQAIKATAFSWDFQAEMLKLTINPELPENEQTEKRRYDYDHGWITCISRVKCIGLLKCYYMTLEKCIKEGTEKFISVPVAEVNQFGIGVRLDPEKEVVTYAKLIRNINPSDLTSQDEIIYEFRKGEIIEDYDNKTGKFGRRNVTDDEFSLFIEDLKSFVMASSKAFNHANRVVDKTYKDMISNDIRSIGKKVGAEMTTFGGGQRGGAQYGQSSLFDNSSKPAQTETIQSLDELELPFN